MSTFYWITAEGGAATTTVNAAPQTPGMTWTLSDEATYDANLATLNGVQADAATAAATAASEALAAKQAARKAAYDNLKASVHTSDWTEETIQIVSRYTPPDPTDGGPIIKIGG